MECAALSSQHRLRPSKGNWIAFGVLMLVGWVSDAGRPDADWAIEAGRSTMLRITDKTIHLDAFGFDIRPAGDWTCLQPIRGDRNQQLVFVNAAEKLIATIRPVQFTAWPPKSASADASSSPTSAATAIGYARSRPHQSVTDLVQLPRISKEWKAEQYGQQTVDWFEQVDFGYLTHRYGRIESGSNELLVDLVIHPGVPGDQADGAIGRLLETIRPLD